MWGSYGWCPLPSILGGESSSVGVTSHGGSWGRSTPSSLRTWRDSDGYLEVLPWICALPFDRNISELIILVLVLLLVNCVVAGEAQGFLWALGLALCRGLWRQQTAQWLFEQNRLKNICFSHPFNEILLFFWGFIRLYFIFCYILLCWSIIYLTECIYVLVLLAFDLIFLFYLHLFLHLFYALFKSLLWSFDFASWTFLFLLFNLACIFTFILFHFRLCFDFMTFEFDAVFWWWF